MAAAESPSDNERLHVLWLIKGLGPGGAEHHLLSLAQAGDRSRFEFSVAYLIDWKDHLVGPLRDVGVNIYCLGGGRLADLRWAWRLRQLLRTHQVDVLHVHSPLVAAVARVVARTVRPAPPTISTEHNVWAARRFATRWVNAATYCLDRTHIAVSEQVLNSLTRSMQRRTQVIGHGVDVDAIVACRDQREEARAELGLRPGQVVVCTVANLRWQKGYPDLLEAARRVIDDGCDVVFLAVGQGPLEYELLARRAALGLEKQFRLLGHRTDTYRILAASDIFVLASLHEGYPIVVLEALAAGLPVVATDVGAVPTTVTDGVEGLVVSTADPTQLASSLLRLVHDPELRRRMGEAAALRGAEFNITPVISRTQQVYSNIGRRSQARQ